MSDDDRDRDGGGPSISAPPPKRRRNIRRRPSADDADDDAGTGGAVLEDARALAGLRDKRKGLSADALLTAPRAAATDGADALLDASAAAAAATDNAGLAAAYVKESAADAAAAAAAADADAFVEAELARRMGLPPPSNPTSAADAWAGARDALYEVPAELRGQRARVGGDAEAYGGGAAVVEVALSAEEAVHNVERTEAAKRTLLGLAPVQRVRAGDADADAARAARAVLPKAFGAAKKGRRG